jgi:hypothetical protein
VIFPLEVGFNTLNSAFQSEVKDMRNILLSFSATILLAALGGCRTTVRTDSGHGVTAGVHDTGHGVEADVHTR